MDPKTLYEERLNRFDDVMSGRIPDRVPAIGNITTWMYHYAGVSVKTAFMEDPDELFRAVKNLHDNVPLDGLMGTSNTLPLKMAERIGEGIYVISDEGTQIKGSGGALMYPEEYKLLIEDPHRFFANVLVPRKFESIRNASFEKKVEMFKQAYADFGEFGAYNRGVNTRIESELGLPIPTRGSIFLPSDIILDYLRDFVGVSTDVRRYSDEFVEAGWELYTWILDQFLPTAPPPNRKVVFSPLHLPTYLRPKVFEKVYLPFMKRYIQEMAIDRGFSLYFFMEANWMPYLDLLQELPEGGKVIGLFETGDLVEIKEKMAGRMAIMGGMPVDLLRFGTVQQVEDKCKELLDTLAPGGSYMFSTDKTLMSLTDGKPENVIAAYTYITEHGGYA